MFGELVTGYGMVEPDLAVIRKFRDCAPADGHCIIEPHPGDPVEVVAITEGPYAGLA
jgi:hypothetical protein